MDAVSTRPGSPTLIGRVVSAYEFLAVSKGVSLEGFGADDLALISETLRPVKALAVA